MPVATMIRSPLAILGMCLLLVACGTGRTLVMEAPQRKAFSAVTLTRSDDTVSVPDEYRIQFANKIRGLLFGTKDKPGPFAEGQGLAIRIACGLIPGAQVPIRDARDDVRFAKINDAQQEIVR